MALDRAFQRISAVGGKLRVRSALNPILWLCAVVSVPGLGLLTVVESVPSWAVVVVSSPPIVACVSYLILLFRDPDKLQSEEYQINKQLLELAQEKGMHIPSLLNLDAATPNPDSPSTDERQEDQ